MSASEEILDRQKRRNRIERASDAFGRVIGVARLKPSQQIKLQELAPGLDGSSEVVDPETGERSQVPRITTIYFAAAVREIDGNPIPFPKTRGELDAILDRLDQEGMEAAVTALGRLMREITEESEGGAGVEGAKNS